MADKKRRMTDEERAAIETRIFQHNPDAKNPYDTEDGMEGYITGWDDTIRNMSLGWLSNPEIRQDMSHEGDFQSAMKALLGYGFGEGMAGYARGLGEYDKFDYSQMGNFMNPSTLLSSFRQHMNEDQFNEFVSRYYGPLKTKYRRRMELGYRRGKDSDPDMGARPALLKRTGGWLEGHLGIW